MVQGKGLGRWRREELAGPCSDPTGAQGTSGSVAIWWQGVPAVSLPAAPSKSWLVAQGGVGWVGWPQQERWDARMMSRTGAQA